MNMTEITKTPRKTLGDDEGYIKVGDSISTYTPSTYTPSTYTPSTYKVIVDVIKVGDIISTTTNH